MIKVLSFKLADELFGIEITKVKEINRNVEYTAVPRSSENIIGLFNMRGQIVTLFNLALMLGLTSKELIQKATCIILKASSTGNPNQRGLVIEKTGDVVDVDEEMCQAPPANVGTYQSKFLKAVVRLDNELLRIVDTDLMFEE